MALARDVKWRWNVLRTDWNAGLAVGNMEIVREKVPREATLFLIGIVLSPQECSGWGTDAGKLPGLTLPMQTARDASGGILAAWKRPGHLNKVDMKSSLFSDYGHLAS